MDVVRASALETAQALDEIDLIGVVTFGKRDNARIELPMVPVQQGERIRKALESIGTKSEGTFVADGLDKAREMLSETEAAIKYVVVITDGEFIDGRDMGLVAAAEYATTKITLCVVQILPLGQGGFSSGRDAEALARMGNGEHIRHESFASVPKIVSVEVENLRTLAGRPARKDESGGKPGLGDEDPEEDDPEEIEPPKPPPDEPETLEQPTEALRVHVLEDSALLAPLPTEGFPGLGGILPVRAKADARTLLAAGQAGIPLLAFANRGLGKIGVWTADFLGPWGESWVTDPQFPGRFAQWVQYLTPAASILQGVVLARPQVAQVVPLPAEIARLESLGGSPVRRLADYVPPSATVQTVVTGRATSHALVAILLILVLALVECVAVRRPPRLT